MLRHILLTLIFGYTSLAQANCDCLWQGSFNMASQQADLIITGTVLNHKGNSADIGIHQTLLDKGINNKEFNTVIRVWGDDGKQCRPNLADFPRGSQWVLSLKKITEIPAGGFNPNTPNISFGRINDYYLSKCGANWLNVHDDYVTGNLVKGQRWEWTNDTMNPVLLPLIKAYIEGVIPEEALIEAAKPQTAAKKLMEETRQFIEQQ